MQKILEKRVRVNFQDTPLSQAVEWLQRVSEVEIRLDVGAEKAARRVSISTHDPICLGSALQQILDPLGLAFTIEGEVIRVHPTKTQPQRTFRVVESDIHWNGGTVDHNGAVLVVLLPATAAANEIQMQVILSNLGRHDFECWETGDLPECRVEAIDEDGNKLPYSRQGSYLFSGDAPRAQYGARKYAPRQSHRWQYDLSKAFVQPIKPGKYTVSFALDPGIVRNEEESTKLRIKGIPLHVH